MVGLAVSLDDGATLLTLADGSSTWQPVPAVRACELAGIPEPAVDGGAETARRLDPFHVERYTSAAFNALVGTILDRGLPCAHALRVWKQGVWDHTFQGAYFEQPETFAASVLEQIASVGDLRQAILTQTAADLGIAVGCSEHRRVLHRTGWQAALLDIDRRVVAAGRSLAASRRLRRDAERAQSPQLTLL